MTKPIRPKVIPTDSSIQPPPCAGIPALEAEVERLRAALSKSIKQRQVEVRAAITARSETEDAILEMYSDCQDEVERLQRELHDEQVRRNKWERMCEELGLVAEPAPDAMPCDHPHDGTKEQAQ